MRKEEKKNTSKHDLQRFLFGVYDYICNDFELYLCHVKNRLHLLLLLVFSRLVLSTAVYI